MALSWCEKQFLPSLIRSQDSFATDSFRQLNEGTQDFLPCSAAVPSVQSAHTRPEEEMPPCSPVPVLAP